MEPATWRLALSFLWLPSAPGTPLSLVAVRISTYPVLMI